MPLTLHSNLDHIFIARSNNKDKTMKTRNLAEIVLIRSNKRAVRYFVSLNTGHQLHIYQLQ